MSSGRKEQASDYAVVALMYDRDEIISALINTITCSLTVETRSVLNAGKYSSLNEDFTATMNHESRTRPYCLRKNINADRFRDSRGPVISFASLELEGSASRASPSITRHLALRPSGYERISLRRMLIWLVQTSSTQSLLRIVLEGTGSFPLFFERHCCTYRIGTCRISVAALLSEQSHAGEPLSDARSRTNTCWQCTAERILIDRLSSCSIRPSGCSAFCTRGLQHEKKSRQISSSRYSRQVE